MIRIAFLLMASIVISSCTKNRESAVLLNKDFHSQHPDWRIVTDTLSTEFEFGYNGLEIPMKISWLIFLDQNNCLRIGHVKLENLEYQKNAQLENLRFSILDCAMKWNSEDERSFESIIIFGDYKTRKNIKTIMYIGPLVEIKGNGESQFFDSNMKD